MPDPQAKAAVEIISSFVSLAKELARLPELALPQYGSAARALYVICDKLLVSVEGISRWYYRFLYFDFRAQGARVKWNELLAEYQPWRNGPGPRELKFRCGDIGRIYHQDIESKFGTSLLERIRFRGRLRAIQDAQARVKEARSIVDRLSTADDTMVSYIIDEVLGRIDEFVKAAGSSVNSDRLDEAEGQRLRFVEQSTRVTEFLRRAGDELAGLVIAFANLARVPITLDR